MGVGDHKGNDSDSPTLHGTSLPGKWTAGAELTPPPLSNAPSPEGPASDAPTLPGVPIAGATPAMPYVRQGAPPVSSISAISAFHTLQPGVLFGGRYEILGVKEYEQSGVKWCEPVADQKADFWSLYGHIPGQGADCIGDFRTREHAEEIYARITGRNYADGDEA